MKLILGSQSPRRQELMGLLGIPFEEIVSACEEVISKDKPDEVTEELAIQKAMAVAERIADTNPTEEHIIVGSDTVVSVDNQILGKPKDKEEARAMIESISGRSHMVYTGVALVKVIGNDIKVVSSFAEGTKVNVAKLSAEEIEAYVNTDEPYDKAGAYGIQGLFGKHVSGIEGDYNTVVGLPVHRVYEELKKL